MYVCMHIMHYAKPEHPIMQNQDIPLSKNSEHISKALQY